MRRTLRGYLAFIVVTALLITLTSQRRDQRALEIDRQTDESWRIWAETRATISFRHEWRDRSLSVRDWVGDTPTVDQSVILPAMVLETDIERHRLHQAMARFGIPDEWMLGDAIRSTYFPQLPQHGFETVRKGKAIEIWPDYEWIIEESKDDLAHATQSLHETVQRSGAHTNRELLRIFASFVQSMEYKLPPPYRTQANGNRVFTSGILMPLEMLYHKWGDCDTKSLLFASLLANLPEQSILFLVGYDHLFVAVRAIPRRGDHFIRVHGVPYVLLELTAPWPIGRVPLEFERRARHGTLEIVPVLDTRR